MIRFRWLVALGSCMVIAPAALAADRDLAIRARVVLKKHCAKCHGDAGRKGELSVLDRAGLERGERPFLVPSAAGKSQLVQLIEDGSMPPGIGPKLSDAEVQIVRDWIGAAAPSYPKQFDDLYVLSAILTDVKNQPEADLPSLRYFSLANLIPDDNASFSMTELRESLRAAINYLSKTELLKLDEADPVGAVFRVDIRKTGWAATPFEERRLVNGVRKFFASNVTLFDVMLLEYPLGLVYPAHEIYRQADAFLDRAKQVRPLAFVRGLVCNRIHFVIGGQGDSRRSGPSELGSAAGRYSATGRRSAGPPWQCPCSSAGFRNQEEQSRSGAVWARI